jgi:hypothetical protein
MNTEKRTSNKPELVNAVWHLLRENGVIISTELVTKVTVEVITPELDVVPGTDSTDLRPQAHGKWAARFRYMHPVNPSESEWEKLFGYFSGDQKRMWHCRDLLRALKASGNRPIGVRGESEHAISWSPSIRLFNRKMSRIVWRGDRCHLFITKRYMRCQMWLICSKRQRKVEPAS